MPGLDEVIKARAEEGEGAIEEAKSYVEKLREARGNIGGRVQQLCQGGVQLLE